MVNNYCPECKVLCGEKFCWRCGKESVSAIVKCPHCEADVSVIGAFCGNCGKPIQEAIQEHLKRGRGGEKSGNAV